MASGICGCTVLLLSIERSVLSQRLGHKHNGRPHWGKVNHATHASLVKVFSRLSDFAALRDQMDPAGMFLNDYLQQRLHAVKQSSGADSMQAHEVDHMSEVEVDVDAESAEHQHSEQD